MKKIAIEEHFYSKGYMEYLRSRKEYPRREIVEENGKKVERDWWSPTRFRVMEPGNPTQDMIANLDAGRLRVMDEAGIDMQMLSLSFPGVELFGPDDGCTVARQVNDEVAEVIAKYPDRFSGLATIAPQAPQRAAGELERAVKTLGLKGAMINGNIQGEFLDQKKFWPIFEQAEKLDVPIYIHAKMPPPEMLQPYLAYPGLASAMSGFAAEASLHAMRLICSGVFDTYPGLKIILGHLGEAIPFWLWRIDSRFAEEKQSDPTSAAFYKDLKKTPSQYFQDHFYVTTSGMFWDPALAFVCSVLGADKVFFATDYPYESSREAVAFMDGSSLNLDDKEAVCFRNAEKLFGL